MLSSRINGIGAVAIGALMFLAAPVLGQSASATIQGVQNGGNYNYTIQLTNTGSAGAPNIGTFWFAWTPPGQPTEYDFLPSVPSAAAGPTGWIGGISAGSPGNSIEYYNSTGSALAPGQTDTFTFTSTDTPTALKNGLAFGFFPFTESFIYTATPIGGVGNTPSGTGVEVLPTFVVPEPASISLGAMACVFFAGRRRRRWLRL